MSQEEVKKNVEGIVVAGSDENKFERTMRRARNDRRERGDRRGNRRGQRDEGPKEYEEVTIAVNRVARVVKGGRRFRFQALVVVGNRKDKVGVGLAKGADVQAAVTKATNIAKKSVVNFPLRGTTIPHEVEIKLTGAHVLLKPAAPGTGIIAGGVVRQIIGTTGISNLISKSLGSSNKINIAYATVKALSELVPKSEWLGYEKKEKKEKKVEVKTEEKGDK
jgi:small subunit ribosomal protein S5